LKFVTQTNVQKRGRNTEESTGKGSGTKDEIELPACEDSRYIVCALKRPHILRQMTAEVLRECHVQPGLAEKIKKSANFKGVRSLIQGAP